MELTQRSLNKALKENFSDVKGNIVTFPGQRYEEEEVKYKLRVEENCVSFWYKRLQYGDQTKYQWISTMAYQDMDKVINTFKKEVKDNAAIDAEIRNHYYREIYHM